MYSNRSLLLCALVFAFVPAISQSISTGSITGSPFCAGANVSVPYTITGTFNAGNVFIAQLSNASGSFAAPVNIGTRTATNAGTITATIPFSTSTGSGYRIRVISSNPAVTGFDNAFNLVINAPSIASITPAATSLCQSQVVSVAYTVGCNFSNSPTANTFTLQLSDASGSFASPVNIGSVNSVTSGTINATIPGGTPAGTGYRMRIVASNPVISSADNGSNITIAATAGTPGVFGTNSWNVYCYSGRNFNSYFGFYTENNVAFDTQTRWSSASSPSSANSASGLAYQGCPVPVDNHSYIYMRQGFTCGFYQLNIPSHDDEVTVFVDGVQVFQHIGCCDAHANVWSGFLGANSTVEIRLGEGGGSSYLSFSLTSVPTAIQTSPPVTVCSGTSTTLSATSSVPLNYAWTPTATLTPPTNTASVVATPSVTTTYTVTGTDPTTACTISSNVLVTVSPTPATAVTSTASTICSTVTTATLSATGANSYTWSPAAGLSATTGNVVIANPATTTTYTVTGSNNCTTSTASTTITVQGPPPLPAQEFGNNVWHVYAHNSTAFDNFYGYYTENNLDFDTRNRYASGASPSAANASSGLAYSGCTFGNTNYGVSYKRTNFTCAYYSLNIPAHDDNVTVLVNGVVVFSHVGCCDSHTNVWQGFVNAATTIEIRYINGGGPGYLAAQFVPASPVTTSPPVTICQTTSTTLTATATGYPAATFAWTPNDGSLATPGNASTLATPNITTNYTVTMTDAGATGCTATANVLVTVDPLPSTAVTPTAISTYCPSVGFTLTATGANTYTWSPAAGLSATTGFQVVASPTSTTTYTVTGSNNCSSNSATTTITVLPLPSPTTFPTGTWNVYGFNTTTLTNYQGYYTENGSGASGYDFNTATRWASGAAPSTANATNGTAYQGCVMSATNISLSFKRTGFTCGIYQINVPSHDDNVTLLINGVQVAQHIGCCDAHTALWTGVLHANSQVEFRLVQGGGGSGLSVQFVPVALPASTTVWLGAVSSDWFNASNWCNGIPSSTVSALIPSAGPSFMPDINGSGTANNVTVNGAVPAGAFTSAIAAAALSMTGSASLGVHGNWSNNGTFTPATSTVSFLGTGSGNSISSGVTETFYNLTINKPNNLTISSGIHQVSNVLSLTNGIVTQNAILEILDDGTTTGASSTSYVNGTLRKTGNDPFTFPVGKSGFYRPLSISAPANVTDRFTAEYFRSPQAFGSAVQSPIDHVSACEYWTLDRTAGTSNVNVTLSWLEAACMVNDITHIPTLRVAQWNGSQWLNLGNGSTTGTNANGTITSASQTTSFLSNNPFTLATTSLANPLPVTLLSFEGSLEEEGIKLSWKTASEKNNDHFILERSTDANVFSFLRKVRAKGTATKGAVYEEYDQARPAEERVYYKLRQKDVDGTMSQLGIVVVTLDEDHEIILSPNPAQKVVAIRGHLEGIKQIRVLNSVGIEICHYPVQHELPAQIILPDDIKSGVYFISFENNEQRMLKKLVVE